MEILHCKGKRTPLKEEAKRVKRGSDRNKSEQRDIHSVESTPVL